MRHRRSALEPRRAKILLVAQRLHEANPITFYATLVRNLDYYGVQHEPFDLSPSLSTRATAVLRKVPPLEGVVVRWLNRRFLRFVLGCDYTHVLVIKGVYLLPWTLKAIQQKRPDIRLGCCNTDDPFHVAPGSSNQRIRASVGHYHDYFCWSKAMVERVAACGPRAHFLPFAADTDSISPADPEARSIDLSFVGNGDSVRQGWVDRVADILGQRAPDVRLHLFGANWKQRPGLVIDPTVTGPRFVNPLRRTRVNLNLLREQNKGATNLRTFEIPASAGFMLHERSAEAAGFFRPDREALYFDSPESLVDIALRFLGNSDGREEIARAAFRRIQDGRHTYRERVFNLLEAFGISVSDVEPGRGA